MRTSKAQRQVCTLERGELVSQIGRVVLEEVISTARAPQRKAEICAKYHANITIAHPNLSPQEHLPGLSKGPGTFRDL